MPSQLTGITNPVVPITEGTYTGVQSDGGPLAQLIARLWTTAAIVGGLVLLLYLIIGAINWLTAAGDADKLKKARQTILDAFIGLTLIVASFAIVLFMQWVFGFNILSPVWPTP